MTEDLIREIRKTNKLLVMIVTKDLKPNEAIILLSKIGFAQKEISELIGAKKDTVNKTLYRHKNKKK